MYRSIKLSLLVLSVAAVALAGCKKSSDNRKSGADTTPINQPITSTPQTSAINNNTFGQVLIANATTKEDKAMNECLKRFGSHPFSLQQVQAYRTINASVRITGIGKGVDDTNVTSVPELVLVKNSLNFFGPKINLQNSNGWYCIDQGLSVGKLKVELHCSARLADSEGPMTANVNNTNNTVGNNLGVNVSSKIAVTKTNCP